LVLPVQRFYFPFFRVNTSMSRHLYLAILTLLSFHVNGQLTLQKDFPLEDIRYFYITDTEGIYVNYSSYSNIKTIRLYNDSQQVIRTINSIEDTILNVINVSKYLYNNDELYEIIYTYHTFRNGISHYNTHIIDENSKLLASLEDQYLWIQNTSSGPRLLSQQGSKVYSLPGINYPVNKGRQGDPGQAGSAGPPGEKGDKGDPFEEVYYAECNCQLSSLILPVDESLFLSEPYPNPAYESSSIDYDVSTLSPDAYLAVFDMTGIKKLSLYLNPPRGTVQIHRSLLGSGVYFLRIEYESGCSKIRQLVFE
jgi:hypothetical protein